MNVYLNGGISTIQSPCLYIQSGPKHLIDRGLAINLYSFEAPLASTRGGVIANETRRLIPQQTG